MNVPTNVLTEQSDLELVQQVRSGDRTAFTVLMRRYISRVYLVARRLARNHEEADEIAQETFVKAYLGLGDFRNDSSFFLWLYRIAVNLSLNAVRKQHLISYLNESPLLARFLPARTTPHNDVESWKKKSGMHRAIAELPDRQRALVVLRLMDGLSFEEVSVVLSLSKTGLQASYIQALRNVKELLENET